MQRSNRNGSQSLYGPAVPSMKPRRQARQSTRFHNGDDEVPAESFSRVDLTKLKVTSLRKYVRAFDLDVNPVSSKEDLLVAVSRHFQSQVVSEKDVVESLVVALKKSHANGGR